MCATGKSRFPSIPGGGGGGGGEVDSLRLGTGTEPRVLGLLRVSGKWSVYPAARTPGSPWTRAISSAENLSAD